jgi:tetratricopeptide (TPR) repeat protein
MVVLLWFSTGPIASCAVEGSATAETLFDAGNKAYEQGKYSDAIAAYEKIERSVGASSALFFNLGNARLKAGQTGRAITAYRMAKRLAPRDADVRANLQFARNQVQGPTVYRNLWERWLDWLSLNEWTTVTACCIWIFFLLITLRQCMPALRQSFRALVPIFGVASILLLGCVVALYHERGTRMTIVVSDVAIAHQGPLDESPPAFTAHDGAELRLLDIKDDWFQVTTDSRRIGWLRKNDAMLVPQM